MLRIKMYQAGNGDAFLICTDTTNILIDGGYASSFIQYIKDDLIELNSANKFLELVITTHIDSDHIGGILKFLSLNGTSTQPSIISVSNIWHNSLRSITMPIAEPLELEKNRSLLQSIHDRGHPKIQSDTDSNAEKIGAQQGSTLATLIHNGGYRWNNGDGTTSITKEGLESFAITGGMIRVLSPSQDSLKSLLSEWEKQLKKYGFKGSISSGELIDDAFEFMLEHMNDYQRKTPKPISATTRKSLHEIYKPDDSPTNKSSIATIIELNGIRILMLADAWAEDIIFSLQKLKDEGHSMIFDAIKISHHGSYHNTSPELLDLIDSPVYFISSNGNRHYHPDIETLIAIVDRPSTFPRTLYCNYATVASTELKNYQTKSEAKFSVIENACDWIAFTGNK
ncbi:MULTISPECIES: AVAST type 1 anti-phage system MBL fold metallo-hydrolase Avs1a [Acinetobacter]|uniref:Metallo-beta-lactamase superfamily protein n=1 Tax=Acinetobacter boissieri TaxID=1219383 RepID=A0A1G6HEA0_9GAMM|nr:MULTISPECIES: AVAST type 1 anti-phage system MBL fold metallo-hydrolase Avs1a [Acinetobacter]MCF8999783.1 MBL fold metallo-hydrolase [Acinetobacter nectaris]MCF9026703.1 MBL fold metallo-hydrolase [Acinetobacter nectaris]SDB92580.1 Metallo-beta-lactamase superfamily protein [Acinetobacter boissieri]